MKNIFVSNSLYKLLILILIDFNKYLATNLQHDYTYSKGTGIRLGMQKVTCNTFPQDLGTAHGTIPLAFTFSASI